jgi:uncharacterized membrane protein YfhO
VLSEIYDPGWHAYLDGKSVPIYLVDYVLRGISVPGGSHRVALRYEPPLLRAGMIISGCAFASLGIYMAIVSWLRYRSLISNRATRATSLSVCP